MNKNPTIERYARQILLSGFGEAGQQKLASATVLVVGCGALGSHIAEHLARAGVGNLRIVDRDVVEMSNLHRQALFDEQDANSRLPKSEAARRKLERINSEVSVQAIVDDVNPGNVERFIEGADAVADGTDNMETRYLLNDACVKHALPWIYGGVLGSTGMCLPVMPGQGPCLACLFPEQPDAGELPNCDTVGVLNAAPALIASVQAAEVQRILITGSPSSQGLLNVDLWSGDLFRAETARNPACPVCGQGRFDRLEARPSNRVATRLVGNAVQIAPHAQGAVDLGRLSDSLAGKGEVSFNGSTLSFKADEGYEIMVFPDGRAICKGTTDAGLAKSLYDRYITG